MKLLDQVMVTLRGNSGVQVIGQNYAFTCEVTGGGTTITMYRWFKSGIEVRSSRIPTLSFTPLTQESAGRYRCEGTRNSIPILSEERTLTVVGK